jgi:hypothetical protein
MRVAAGGWYIWNAYVSERISHLVHSCHSFFPGVLQHDANKIASAPRDFPKEKNRSKKDPYDHNHGGDEIGVIETPRGA